jgi:hypothetical protein
VQQAETPSADSAPLPDGQSPAIDEGDLTFSRSHSKKSGRFLLNVLTATMRTLRSFLVVLVQGKNRFEGLVTIEANIIVDGHGDLPRKSPEIIVCSLEGVDG